MRYEKGKREDGCRKGKKRQVKGDLERGLMLGLGKENEIVRKKERGINFRRIVP